MATQPESSSSTNSSQQKDALITEVLLPPCLEASSKDSGDVGFYHSCYEEFQLEISRSFDEIRKSDDTKESSKRYCTVFLRICLLTNQHVQYHMYQPACKQRYLPL